MYLSSEMQDRIRVNVIHNHADPNYKPQVERMKPDTEGDPLCDSIYVKFKIRQKWSNTEVLEVRILVTCRLWSGCGELWLGGGIEEPSGGLGVFDFLIWVLFVERCSLFEDSLYYTYLCILLYALINISLKT